MNQEMDTRKRKRSYGRKKEFRCHVCGKELPFCWTCRCGFQICPECLEKNKWGMSNDVTWFCPDCGKMRSF